MPKMVIPMRLAEIKDVDFLTLACEATFLHGRTELERELLARLEMAVNAASAAETEMQRLVDALFEPAAGYRVRC
ncbi:hypothetical protein GALL_201850 [mine drainage metagenome]|uniref:Uncharacterized protein n=1 Tax=mine drainage metagenome TaxID=410659 RepID=A0A1J5S0P1_9ZZZZ